ncbi:MAG: hypothetical protein LJE84_09585 [Gammaproteobacteria bacterium]|nr:hypothetical protein [Gammaproteobacteria bacterium]
MCLTLGLSLLLTAEVALPAGNAGEKAPEPGDILVATPPQAQAPLSRLDHDLLEKKLDLAQQQLDAARKRLEASGARPASMAQIDAAQRLLDQSRARLLGLLLPQTQQQTREQLRQQLQDAEQALEQTRAQLAGKPGLETNRERLEESQRRLAEARSRLHALDNPAPAAPPSAEQLRAMFKTARTKLDEARSIVLSSPHADAATIEKLEQAEKRLEDARQRSIALGLLD